MIETLHKNLRGKIIRSNYSNNKIYLMKKFITLAIFAALFLSIENVAAQKNKKPSYHGN